MTRSTSIAPRMRGGSSPFAAGVTIALGAILAIGPTQVLAEAQVRGSPDAVRIETQNASIEEVLAALGGAFDLRYRSSANLAKQLSGTYEGSLQRVVARVLEGYDFVLKTNQGRLEITVLGTRNAAPAAAVASSTSTPAKGATTSPATPLPAAAPSKASEQPATQPPAAPSLATKVAEVRPSVALLPGPVPGAGPAPIPGPVPGAATIPPPTPGAGPTPVPEPVPGAASVPPPTPDLSSAPVPTPLPASVPAPGAVDVPPSVAASTSPVERAAPARQ